MKSAEKEKMCVSCEGRIPFDADICPYCATDQNVSKLHNSFQAPLFQNQSLEDSLTSLYTPPYQGKRPQFSQPSQEDALEPPPMPLYREEAPMYKEVTERQQKDPLLGATVEYEEEVQTSSLWPTFFLLLGANVFLLGLMQLFFSQNGIFCLEWNANYWFFYCLLGGPALFYGYKKLKTLG